MFPKTRFIPDAVAQPGNWQQRLLGSLIMWSGNVKREIVWEAVKRRVNPKCETSREGRLRGRFIVLEPRTDCHRSVDQQADEKVSGGASEAFWSANCIIRRNTWQAEWEVGGKREVWTNFVTKRLTVWIWRSSPNKQTTTNDTFKRSPSLIATSATTAALLRFQLEHLNKLQLQTNFKKSFNSILIFWWPVEKTRYMYKVLQQDTPQVRRAFSVLFNTKIYHQ